MFSPWPPPIQTDSISSQSLFLINATLVLTLKYPYFKPLFPNSRIHVFNKYLLSTTYHALFRDTVVAITGRIPLVHISCEGELGNREINKVIITER